MRAISLVMATAFALGVTAANAQSINWDKVDAALGRKAAVTGDVHRYGFPRTDLTVTLDGVTIKPGLALGGWVAFMPAHGGAMIMGDLVLLEGEINPVMTAMIIPAITGAPSSTLRSSGSRSECWIKCRSCAAATCTTRNKGRNTTARLVTPLWLAPSQTSKRPAPAAALLLHTRSRLW